MEYLHVAGTDLKASRIGLGTWAIGGWMWGGTDEKRSIKTIQQALDKDINLIDTAPAYGFGRSEEIVGKAIEEADVDRDDVILSTKVGLEWEGEQVFRNTSRERIFKEVEDSLERLGTDYIDIYLVHWPDPETPIEETAKAMKDLYEEGKIKAIGVSNFSTEQMDEFRKYAPLHACQPPFNLLEREIEKDVLPYCLEKDIHLLTYGALCRGLLTGKMERETEFEGDDMRKAQDPKFQEPLYSDYLDAVDRLDDYVSDKYDRSVIHLSVRWVLDMGAHTALWGARRPDQLEPVKGVTGWSLTDEELNEVVEIIEDSVENPVGPEFMAPPSRDEVDL
ncbi:MAG: aldo/keto reductase [Candidatus Thermoplasmatota archaeon]|nr:aldo/keto reductase [Candidatus Thermoplasmatota archaeon]